MPHPAYRLGWGRVSCLACIFGQADQVGQRAADCPWPCSQPHCWSIANGNSANRSGQAGSPSWTWPTVALHTRSATTRSLWLWQWVGIIRHTWPRPTTGLCLPGSLSSTAGGQAETSLYPNILSESVRQRNEVAGPSKWTRRPDEDPSTDVGAFFLLCDFWKGKAMTEFHRDPGKQRQRQASAKSPSAVSATSPLPALPASTGVRIVGQFVGSIAF